MADLAITVDMSQVEAAKRKADNLTASLARNANETRKNSKVYRDFEKALASGAGSADELLSAFSRLEKAGMSLSSVQKGLEQDAKMLASSYQEYYNELLGINRGHKSAATSAASMREAFQQQEREAKQAQKAQQQYNREVRQLKRAYQEGFPAFERAEQEIRQLVKAKRSGVISAERYQQEIQQLKAEYRSFQAGTEDVTMANNRFARQVGIGNTKSMNSLGVAVQQSGYQIGDFLVQVQSGTNAFVAFGQQATQLVGILPAFADDITFISRTALVGLSAGLGIVIPLVTALGGAFMRTREGAKTFEDELQNLENTTSSLKEVQDILSMSTEELGKKFGDAAQSVREYAKVESELQSALARSEMSNALEQLDGLIEKYGEATVVTSEFGESLDISENLRVIKRDFGIVGNEAQRLQRAFSDIMDAETFESQRQAVNNLLSATDDLSISMSDMPKPVAEMLLQFFKANRQIEESEAIIKALERGLNNSADEADRLVDNYEKALDTLSEFGSKVARDVKEFEDRARKAAEYLEEAGFNAKEIANVDIEDGVKRAADAALLLAVRLGVSLRAAEEIVRAAGKTTADIRYERGQLPGAPGGGIPGGATSSRELSIFSGGALETLLGGGSGGDAGGTSGGGGTGETLEDRINKARDAVNKLRASYDEYYATQLKVEEAERQIAEALELGVIENKTEADRILQQYTESLRETDSVMGDFANSAAKEMSNAFMSIVDGSKSASDAFQNMAQAIIRQAFEMAVINPIMNSIFGGFSGYNALPTLLANANGNAFINGRVTPFADGGVVNQPTVFPMANGAGLMGEAGPEAIMPLKRGKDGKLGVQAEGSSQPVVIHQNININGNGDEYILQKISQEAPKIANLTKQQILDQRRRGGVMKSTFG